MQHSDTCKGTSAACALGLTILHVLAFPGVQMKQPCTAETEAGNAGFERDRMVPQQDTSASSVSAQEDGNCLSSSGSSTFGDGAQQSATITAAVSDISHQTSDDVSPEAPADTGPSPVKPIVHPAAAPPPEAGSAAIPPVAGSAQHADPIVGTGALSLDRTVAGILDLDTDGPTNASTDLDSHEEQAADSEVSRSSPAGDDMTGCAPKRTASHSTAAEVPNYSSHAAARPERGDTNPACSSHATDSAAEDPGSDRSGFDTEQEDALLAALGIDEDLDAHTEEESYSDIQEIDVCAEA